MKYQIDFHPAARKKPFRLPKDVFGRIRNRVTGLEDNPRPPNARKLAGSEEWRLRIGRWQVVYLVDDTNRRVYITVIAHRRDVYR